MFQRREDRAGIERIEMRKNCILWSLNSLRHQKHSVLRQFEMFVVLSFSVNSFDINVNETVSQLKNIYFIFLL